MSIFEPKFDTYQDVRTALTWWSIPIWMAMMFAIYFGVLPAGLRATLKAGLPGLAEWLRSAGSLVVAFVVACVLSQLMIHIIEIHDKVYDRWFVGWRRRYDSQFILPALLEPLEDELPPGALSVAQANPEESMRLLYYAFVRDRDMKIAKNLVVRFYEVVTKYWLTQLLEVAALIVAIFDAGYALADRALGKGLRPSLVWTLAGAILAWLLGRASALLMRPKVAHCTMEEIDAIHKDCVEAFRRAVGGFFRNHGIDAPTL